ncbi:HDIG domain-containing metalloprotein [Clostridium folliculivorans]|uniref:Phosphohydrolase n=1 Tax=Clostridium folliculivorans TaxID=2886038 RepID=A0A9W6DCA5_9CLOT|nr:HDIG domain-containing metalloprotein [Clostridium folliculivorans]GKU27285.1 phosphohydrolase [Clostridium folliculivorans]GKU32136.1 phosphohydrolase [Clostridium folliculivorans]
MIFYRVKQFWWVITCNFKQLDEEYINEYLEEHEKKLFDKLKIGDKHHCVRVSKDSLEIYEKIKENLDEYQLAKAALLHDIGKSERPLNFIEKSIVVLLHKFTKGKIRKYDNIKILDIYYNHPKKGVDMLQNYGYKEEFLQVIGNHHDKKHTDNTMLNIVRESDNKN